MKCLKCGVEIGEEQVFCCDCLKVMQKYPVKPGIAVQLPHRRESPALKKAIPKRRGVSPEEQLQRLRKTARKLLVLWLVTLALLAATIYPTVEYFLSKRGPLTGQNYTAIVSTSRDSNLP